MIGFLTVGSASTMYQAKNNMSNYAANTNANTIYNNLLSLYGYLNVINNTSLLNFQTISSYCL